MVNYKNTAGEFDLPKGWVCAELENCAKILDSQRIPVNADERGKRISDKSNAVLYPYYGATGQVGWIDDYLFDEELVLLGEDGAPFFDFLKNKAYIIKGKTWVNNHAHVLKAIFGITLNQFLCHYLNLFDYHSYVTGTTRPKLNQSPMRRIPVPLPPLPEQHRIVAKIEKLFTKLDAGIEPLMNVKVQLKRYRQAVLKHAFEGKLTAEWRAKHKDESEPASRYLERLETELIRKDKHKMLRAIDTSSLPELPNTWQWTSASRVCSSVRDGTHDTPKYVKEGVPLITSKNLKEDGLDFLNTRNISIDDHKKISIRSGVDIGDILFAMIGTIGNPVVVRTNRIFSIKNVGLFKKNDSVINSNYLKYWLESSLLGRILEEKELLKGTTQRFIPLGHLRILPIPYTLLVEQRLIVEEIERRFSIADEIEKTVEQSLKQAERLRQSILKRAFEGNLVPQDPNDEPAEKLLERIKTEKAKYDIEKSSKKSWKGKTRQRRLS